MSLTVTHSHTHTATYARHIASKIAADLKRVQRLIGNYETPSDSMIDNFQQEAVILLRHQCIKKVIYGFHRDNEWIFAIKYQVSNNVLSDQSDDPGGILPYAINGGDFLSVLTYSHNWEYLDSSIKNSIPVQRIQGKPPTMEGGWDHDRRYVAGDLGMQRGMYRK